MRCTAETALMTAAAAAVLPLLQSSQAGQEAAQLSLCCCCCCRFAATATCYVSLFLRRKMGMQGCAHATRESEGSNVFTLTRSLLSSLCSLLLIASYFRCWRLDFTVGTSYARSSVCLSFNFTQQDEAEAAAAAAAASESTAARSSKVHACNCTDSLSLFCVNNHVSLSPSILLTFL